MPVAACSGVGLGEAVSMELAESGEKQASPVNGSFQANARQANCNNSWGLGMLGSSKSILPSSVSARTAGFH